MRSTKNSLSKPHQTGCDTGAVGCGNGAFGCDSLLWIGDSDHVQMHAAWRVCCTHSDAISLRRTLTEAIESPPQQMPTHLIVAQTNRHDGKHLAIDGPVLGRLRSCYPNVNALVLRSPLVAPTVRLPQVNSSARRSESGSGWVESISSWEAIEYLPHWLTTKVQAEKNSRLSLRESCVDRNFRGAKDDIKKPLDSNWKQNRDEEPLTRGTQHDSFLPIVIVASRYAIAEPLIDSLTSLSTGGGSGPLMIQWQRELTPRSARGFATVLWDESAAPPTTAEDWRARCARATAARHGWMTAMASWPQRQLACENGIDTVLEKPGRLESLLASLAVAPQATTRSAPANPVC